MERRSQELVQRRGREAPTTRSPPCLALLALLLAAACVAPARSAATTARVVAVIDGDTLTVQLEGDEVRVRLIGVDTPEGRHPDRPVEHFAEQAERLTRTLAGGRTVTLTAEPGHADRDRFGRLLRYVWLPDGTLLNAEIIRRGHGFALTRFPFSRMEEFRRLEREARAARRGLWADVDEPARIDWREAHRYVGREVVVEGRLVTTHDSGRACFLNFHEDWRRYLTAVIFDADREVFPADPAEHYRGRTVRLRGRVAWYRGAPQIVLRRPGQIEVLAASERPGVSRSAER